VARKAKKRYRRYIRGNVNEVLPLLTLGPTAVVSTPNGDVVDEKSWISSLVARWSMQGFTPTVDDGPIMVGVAHSDYTNAEIEAWIELTTGWAEGDLVSREIAKRKIRKVGVFEHEGIADVTTAMALS
jgi:hypothetical protein